MNFVQIAAAAVRTPPLALAAQRRLATGRYSRPPLPAQPGSAAKGGAAAVAEEEPGRDARIRRNNIKLGVVFVGMAVSIYFYSMYKMKVAPDSVTNANLKKIEKELDKEEAAKLKKAS